MMTAIFGMPPAAGTTAGFGNGNDEWGKVEGGNGDVAGDSAWCWPCWLRS